MSVGGALGAVARYGLTVAVPTPPDRWPWATFVTNVTGCLAIGALMVIVVELTARAPAGPTVPRAGLLGGFTTFSTYALETRTLVADGHGGLAAAYVVASLLARAAGGVAGRPGRPRAGRRGGRRRHPRRCGGGVAMRLTGTALRLTVYLGEDDQWHHRPLYTEIVRRAHDAGLAGASVFRGVEGFGASSLVHTTRLLSLSEDLPVAVVIVDTEERVRGFLPELDELVNEGLVVLDEVEVVRYVGRRIGALVTVLLVARRRRGRCTAALS